MKKLLLIGAMLIVGITSSAIQIQLTEDGTSTGGKQQYTGEGTMEVGSRGRILDTTGKVVLVVSPASSTGADHTALAFDFGRLTKHETSIKQSEFIAQVLKDDTPIKLVDGNGDSAIKAQILNGQLQELRNEQNAAIGTIKYAMSEMSGLDGDKLTYRGNVKAEISTGRQVGGVDLAGDTPTGTFSHNTSSIKVTVTDINVQ